MLFALHLVYGLQCWTVVERSVTCYSNDLTPVVIILLIPVSIINIVSKNPLVQSSSFRLLKWYMDCYKPSHSVLSPCSKICGFISYPVVQIKLIACMSLQLELLWQNPDIFQLYLYRLKLLSCQKEASFIWLDLIPWDHPSTVQKKKKLYSLPVNIS